MPVYSTLIEPSSFWGRAKPRRAVDPAEQRLAHRKRRADQRAENIRARFFVVDQLSFRLGTDAQIVCHSR